MSHTQEIHIRCKNTSLCKGQEDGSSFLLHALHLFGLLPQLTTSPHQTKPGLTLVEYPRLTGQS